MFEYEFYFNLKGAAQEVDTDNFESAVNLLLAVNDELSPLMVVKYNGELIGVFKKPSEVGDLAKEALDMLGSINGKSEEAEG